MPHLRHLLIALYAASVLAWLNFSPGPAFADQPVTDLLYNLTETTSLNYECNLIDNYLECKFVQVMVRRKGRSKNLDRSIDNSEKGYLEFKATVMSGCNKYLLGAGALFRKGLPPPGEDEKKFKENFKRLTPIEKEDGATTFDILEEFCKKPSLEKFLSMIEFLQEREMRTCTIATHTYVQRFKQIPESQVWVIVQDGPEGICGIVDVSRFEKAKESHIFWNYFSKKLITNKTGVINDNMNCSDLDESERAYLWKPREIGLGCDYITFGF